MNRNDMAAFSALERMRHGLLGYNLEIRHVDRTATLALVNQGDPDQSHLSVPLGKLEHECGAIIARSLSVTLLVRNYGTTHDRSKATMLWLIAQAALSYVKIERNEEAIAKQPKRILDFLKLYAEITKEHLGIEISSQPLQMAFACYMVESNSWM